VLYNNVCVYDNYLKGNTSSASVNTYLTAI